MTQQEILDYNARCAEFRGEDIGHSNMVLRDMMWTPMKYHSDWNWIHSIVELIYKTPNPKENGDTTIYSFRGDIVFYIGRSNKDYAVQSINQFLIWYNKNKQP